MPTTILDLLATFFDEEAGAARGVAHGKATGNTHLVTVAEAEQKTWARARSMLNAVVGTERPKHLVSDMPGVPRGIAATEDLPACEACDKPVPDDDSRVTCEDGPVLHRACWDRTRDAHVNHVDTVRRVPPTGATITRIAGLGPWECVVADNRRHIRFWTHGRTMKTEAASVFQCVDGRWSYGVRPPWEPRDLSLSDYADTEAVAMVRADAALADYIAKETT